jgi:hypothetical protein
MGLDIRLPIGFLFSIFGVLLIAFRSAERQSHL